MERGLGIFHLVARLVLLQVLRVKSFEHVGDFEFVECTWNKTEFISIEKVDFQPEFDEMISEWPGGPYALPMPIDGCPESSIKGWKQGYIDLTWQQPYVVMSRNRSAREFDNHKETFEQPIDVTRVRLPEIQSFLTGPFSSYKIKLNFCFKIKRDETLDVGIWPEGSYSIYGVKTGCPNGFISEMTNITIGKVSHSMYDGYLPKFKLQRNGHGVDYIEMLICTHAMIHKPDPEKHLVAYNYPFIFLQLNSHRSGNDSLQCPLISDLIVTELVLYVHQPDDSSNVIELFRFCYFRPHYWTDHTFSKLKEFLVPKDTFVIRAHVSTGEHTTKSESFSNIQKNIQINSKQGIAELLAWDFSKSTTIRWKLLDLGRTVSIYGIFIQDKSWPIKKELRCYYSNVKWDFLRFGANICSFSVNYTFPNTIEDIYGYTLILKREIDGRYLAFVDGPEYNFDSIFTTDVEFNVLTTRHSYMTDESTRCNIDMGITDHGIDDFQISASSSLQNFPATLARPFLSSWCASVNDTSPWILIDLLRPMRVEGITIWNREYVFETINNGSIDKHILKIGAKSFSVSFGDSEDNLTIYNNQVFSIDATYSIEDAQGFIFHLPIYARILKVHVLEPLAHALSCLRFELHGCRKSGTKKFECITSKDIKPVPPIYNPSERSQRVYRNVTVNECNNLCINNPACSFVNHFSDGSCLHYGLNHNKTWMLDSSGTSGMTTSAKICSSDYIYLPYVAYTFKTSKTFYRNVTVLAYLSIVEHEAILTSIGYPLKYGAGENYKWLINFDKTDFIKLVFTDVNMNIYSHDDDDERTVCQDQLIFSEEASRFPIYSKLYSVYDNSFEKAKSAFIVDNSYNGHMFAIETELSYFTLTFIACLQTDRLFHNGNGFRVIVSKQDIPACLLPANLAKDERLEYCDKPHMSLSSMTYLNIPFARRNESWIIYRERGFLRINIIEFDIKCNTEIKFSINDRFAGEKTFCNLDRPPSSMYTSSGSMTVHFTSQSEKSDGSFRLVYTNIYETYETVSDAISSKGGDIPAIYESAKSEAKFTDDIELKRLLDQRSNSLVSDRNFVRLLYKVCSEKFRKCFSIFSYFGTWNRAGNECWIRRQRLVSIRNKEEYGIIKYLLRNFKLLVDTDSEILRSAFRHNETEIYHTYIGLHRKDRGNDRNRFFWENRTPVFFSAWKIGEPSTGDCTRMGFYMANENQTWETISCLTKSAFYFICETAITSTNKGIEDRQFSKRYKGNISVTVSGYTCQRWDTQYPHTHHYKTGMLFPDATVTDAANYCRDPTESLSLWCLTTDPDEIWDSCYLNELDEDISPHVYKGKLDKARDGSKCVSLDSSKGAYCRHLNDQMGSQRNSHGFLWCFGHNEGITKECNFIDTASDRCWQTHYLYDGAWNSTVSGKQCERWDLFMSQENLKDLKFPETDHGDSANYCRDPTAKGFSWCYISHSGDMWEVCTVEYGNNVLGSSKGTILPPVEYFECQDGKLVNAFERCNGVIDCDDASDETKCLARVHPLLKGKRFTKAQGDIDDINTSLFYQCNNQELVSFLARCDGVLDCEDVSDEINCTYYNGNCSKDHFKCGDGSCIHVSLFCNFITDCIDMSDEACDNPSCSAMEYTCTNGQCIPGIKRCNAIPDCLDGTDETDCESCQSGTFHCDYVRCISDRFKCDTFVDCEDGSDEMSCRAIEMKSCREWWEAGYSQSGMYKISVSVRFMEEAVIDAYCDFSFINQSNELYTVFVNVDIMERDGETIIYTGYLDDEPYDVVLDFIFNSDVNVDCTQEVVQACAPSVQAAIKSDDLYPYCYCLVVTFVIDWKPQISAVRYCNASEPMNMDDIGDKLLFTYNHSINFRVIEWKSATTNVDYVHLKVGNIICTEKYSNSGTTACAEGRHAYNVSVRCMYDVDRTDTITGCRSGSHLHNCDYYSCPLDTVKCPGSYCIPLRFVCDGIEQCPNAEDEFGCGCEDTEREVVIIHEERMHKRHDIVKLSKLLLTPHSIIRSIQYKSTQLSDLSKGIHFSHRILEIKDTEITPSELIDRNYMCTYKLLANQFLNNVRFTKHLKQSILFIQSSPESELIARLMFTNITKKPNFTIYRVLEPTPSRLKVQEFPFVIDVAVKNWEIMHSLASRYLPKLCREAFSTSCPGSYKCSSSKICITPDQVCDGHADCIHGDDELLCNFVCPDRCVCNGFVMVCSLYYLNSSHISLFPKQTRSLTISTIGETKVNVKDNMLDFPFMYTLNLSNCKIYEIQANAFIKLGNLRNLDISYNQLTHLFPLLFNGLHRLKIVNLDGNDKLTILEPHTFKYLHSLTSLRIIGTNIRTIVSNAFAGLSLKHLTLANNQFENIEEFGFGNLNVEHVNFKSNIISMFDKGIFTGVYSLKSLRTPAYKYCCVRPNYVLEDDCFPHKDEFSSCEDLMRSSILQTMLWLIGLCSLLGNILSVIYRLSFDRERLKLGYGVFVTNLAVADFLMGIYLIIIAVADAVFRNRYIFMDDYWRNSSWCTFAGVLSTLSSEASVMFLCLITLDRLLVIKYPFGQVRFDTKKALVCSLFAWIICVIISVFPVLYSAYFKNSFYNKSGVCIALPLTRDRPPGWMYSVLIFVGFNFVTFVLIAFGQWSIYMDIRKSGKALGKKQSTRKKDLLVARNLLLVVATDFLCWFPIGCTGIMALSGRVISGDVYAWASVFILPVNSALNPVLYTLTAILGKKSFTPRKDEQSKPSGRIALGKKFLVIKSVVSQRFYVLGESSLGSYHTVGDALQESESITLNVMIKMSHQLVETLCVLHKSSLMLGNIDEQTLYVKVFENKITGDIQVRQEPSICRKPTDTSNDVNAFGLFLSALVHKWETKN